MKCARRKTRRQILFSMQLIQNILKPSLIYGAARNFHKISKSSDWNRCLLRWSECWRNEVSLGQNLATPEAVKCHKMELDIVVNGDHKTVITKNACVSCCQSFSKKKTAWNFAKEVIERKSHSQEAFLTFLVQINCLGRPMH